MREDERLPVTRGENYRLNKKKRYRLMIEGRKKREEGEDYDRRCDGTCGERRKLLT